MAFTRAWEENDVSRDIKRIYSEARAAMNLPYIPTVFKVLANSPDYLKVVWNDLGPVVRSKEFHAAALALEEYIYSLVVAGGWRFNEQRRELQDQRFSVEDTIFVADAVAIFDATRGGVGVGGPRRRDRDLLQLRSEAEQPLENVVGGDRRGAGNGSDGGRCGVEHERRADLQQ